MIKPIENINLLMNVYMKDGTNFLGCDIPDTKGSDTMVGFWYDNAIRYVPLTDVKYVDYYNGAS